MRSYQEQRLAFVGGIVNGVCAWYKQGLAKESVGLKRELGDFICEDGLYTIGNVGKGELFNWTLQGGVGG